jgi:hypothetical protein
MRLSILPQQMLREDNDILAALAQWDQLQDHDREPMVQVGAEASLRHATAEPHLGGGDELDIHRVICHRSQAPQALLLDDFEELALEWRGERVNLV